MVVLGQKWLYSGRSGCILVKFFYSGKSGCIRAKVDLFGKRGFIREKVKTSFEKNCFSAWASTLNMGLINKVDMVCLSPVGIWCLADVSSVSPSSEQTGELWANQCLNSW